MKHTTSMTAVCCLAAISIAMLPATKAFGKKKAEASPSPAASASATPTAAPSASPALSPGAKLVRVIPFHGMVSAVDAKAKTFTIAGKGKTRVFKVTDQSTITKTGAAATMKDVVENQEIRGSYWKEADGTLMARTVKVGPLTEQEKAAEEKRKAKRAEKKAAKAAAAASASPSAAASASPTPKP